MSRYDFWTHGVNVQIEHSHSDLQPSGLQRTSLVAPGGEQGRSNPCRTGFGTEIQQGSGSNWFHLAIPTPTYLNGHGGVALSLVNVDFSINQYATVRSVVVLDARHESLAELRDLTISHRDFGVSLQDIHKPVNGGVVVSVFVDFVTGPLPDNQIGSILFRGAGAFFDVA